MTGNLPQVIVVGDQRLADILATCGAVWNVLPAVPNVNVLWDQIETGALPGNPEVMILTDGTSSIPDELEASVAAFAPYSRTFVVATAARGPQVVARARALANQVENGDPSAPIGVLPAENLREALEVLRAAVAGLVSWPATPVTPPPVAAAPVAAPQPAVGAPVAPAPVAPPVAAPAVAPVVAEQPSAAQTVAVPPAPAQEPARTVLQSAGSAVPRDYEQNPLIDPTVSRIASEVVTKRIDAIAGQKTIAVMSSKGGSGKSTTAICLAGMIARSTAAAGNPKKVVLVDLDTRDGQVGSFIGQFLPTSVSIRMMPRWDAETVTANLVHDRRLGIDALLAPMRPRNADDVGPEFYKQIIQVLQTTHDIVILDCSVNYLDPLLGVGFSLADQILFVTTLATTSVHGMARALTELFADPAEGGLGIPRQKVKIVANAIINNVGMGKDKLLRAALGADMVGQIPAEHDEVLIQTNSNRMDNLLRHPRLGPAYFNLARNVVPDWDLVPLSTEAARILPDQNVPAAQANAEPRKRGLFGNR